MDFLNWVMDIFFFFFKEEVLIMEWYPTVKHKGKNKGRISEQEFKTKKENADVSCLEMITSRG